MNPSAVKALFVNHTSAMSGGEQSLLDLVLGLPEPVLPVVACPGGELADRFRGHGIQVVTIPQIDASLRLHPIHTPRGLSQIGRSALAVRRAVRKQSADLVHANSIRAGLVATIATRAGRPPLIVHVRDCLPAGRVGDATRRFIAARATKVLANSRYTAANFRRGSDDGEVEVVYSPVDLERFDPDRLERTATRARLGLSPRVPLLGVVGQITPWKGQGQAVRAVGLVAQRIPDVKLLVVGSVKFTGSATRYDNASYLRSLHQLVDELGLGEQVRFVGEREDVPEILGALDLLLVPSWEEPFGRTVVEAMAVGTPVLATSVGGPAEVIEDGVSGRLLPPREPGLWAQVIDDLIRAPELRAELASNGRRRVLAFSRAEHVKRVVAAYRDALARQTAT